MAQVPHSSADSVRQPLRVVIRGIPVFESLDDLDLDRLVDIATWRDLDKGEFLMRQGYDVESYYLIASGIVRIFKHSRTGREFTLSVVRGGRAIGGSALFTLAPSPVSACTMAPTSVVALRGKDFLSFLMQSPQVMMGIAGTAFKGLDTALNIIMDLLTDKADIRIVKVLSALCADFGNTLPFSHQQIADMAGITRETASEVLAGLADSGITRSVHGSIQILDRDRLVGLHPSV